MIFVFSQPAEASAFLQAKELYVVGYEGSSSPPTKRLYIFGKSSILGVDWIENQKINMFKLVERHWLLPMMEQEMHRGAGRSVLRSWYDFFLVVFFFRFFFFIVIK